MSKYEDEIENWRRNQWKSISRSNKPIEDWLYTMDGNGKSLIDIGCGAGYLSDIAIKRGFKVTSVDFGETPYIHNIKKDVVEMGGYYDYLIGAGFPPANLPTKLKIKNFIYTTSRDDLKKYYPGTVFYSNGVWIMTNLEPLSNWKEKKENSFI